MHPVFTLLPLWLQSGIVAESCTSFNQHMMRCHDRVDISDAPSTNAWVSLTVSGCVCLLLTMTGAGQAESPAVFFAFSGDLCMRIVAKPLVFVN